MIKNYIKRIFRFVNSTMSKIHWQISGSDVFVGRRSKIVHGKLISFGDHVNIQPDCLIVAFPGNAKFKIGMGADIGRFSRIACKNKIIIEENVFTGPNFLYVILIIPMRILTFQLKHKVKLCIPLV